MKTYEKTKESNPKYNAGLKKAPYHFLPTQPIIEMGLGMLEGGRKYGAHNYRAVGVRHSTYINAAKRHLDSHWEGEDTDPDSGLPHIIKAADCCVVLRDSVLMGNDTDDRPIPYPNGIDWVALNTLAQQICQRYPEYKEPFTRIRQTMENQ